MLEIFREKPDIAKEAMKAKFMPGTLLQIVIFIGVFLVAQFITLIISGIYLFATQFETIMSAQGDPNAIMSNNSIALVMLFLTVLTTILAIVYCRFIEKRSLYSMGFVKKNILKNYFLGLIIGFVMFGAAVLICVVTGTLVYEGFVFSGSIAMILLFFVGFFIQGMSEEVLVRGYLMITLTTKRSILFAVIVNASFFAVMHLLNSGITVLSVVNLFLFGVFASIFTLKTNSIIGICAIHTIWNFVQGNVFGILVSGMKLDESIFAFTPTKVGTLINGGDFGLEGGLAVTIVLIVSTVVTMLVKSETVGMEEEVMI